MCAARKSFTGEVLSPPGLPETCQRGGHIPSARNITWAKACNEDGTFKSFDNLKTLYEGEGHKRKRSRSLLIAVSESAPAIPGSS